MIMGSFARLATETVRDHEVTPRRSAGLRSSLEPLMLLRS